MGKKILAAALLGTGLATAYAALGVRGLVPWTLRLRQESAPPADGKKPRVVVLGGGFAGRVAVGELARGFRGSERGEIVLVDRHNYNLFTPLLYQVATGEIEPDHIASSLRQMFASLGVTFRSGEVEAIDLPGKRVITDTGTISYDYLLIALGAETNYFGMANVARHTRPLKELRDGALLRNRVLGVFERADLEPDPERRRDLLTFVVVGAGGTGVELACSLQDYISGTLAKDYPRIDVKREAKMILVEARDEILMGFDRSLAGVALERLRALGIDVRLSTRVVDVSPGELRTADGAVVHTHCVVWAAGIKASSPIHELPVPRGRDGRVEVDEHLEVPGYPGVYVVGDAARAVDAATGQPLPPNVPVAEQSGRLAARNILRSLRGEQPKAMRYRYLGEAIALGRSRAVAEIGPLKMNGFPGWLVFRIYYLYRLLGMRNRMRTLASWLFAYFYRREAVRIEC